MRSVRKARPSGQKAVSPKKREPLAEGIIPLTKDGRRNWAKMSDEELLDYAQKFVNENRIRCIKVLLLEDSGLYSVLWRRKLIGRIEFKERRRDWAGTSDEECLSMARSFIKENGIWRRIELIKGDHGLYIALHGRGLLDTVFSEIDNERKREAVLRTVEGLEEFGS